MLRRALGSLLVFACLWVSPTYGDDCVAPKCTAPEAVAELRTALASSCDCIETPNRRAYRRCVKRELASAVSTGQLPPTCKAALRRCERRSTCGRPGAVVCCGVRPSGSVSTRIASQPRRCIAGATQLACPAFASTADACADDGTCTKPNVVLILVDDLGWGDIGAFGATDIRTPNIDELASEGLRLTDFYAAPSCTPARAELMTGSYGQRVSVPPAFFPAPINTRGLNPDEITIAELLGEAGYATGLFGKWHLGDAPAFLPTRQGFDEFFGIPYSNDIGPLHPLVPGQFPDLPLLDGEAVVELNPDQSQFTRRFTDRAVDFIDRHASEPFFLYLAQPMPHIPLFASEDFEGESARGLYGDVVEELDASVGDVLDALERNNLDRNTLVLFLSDNGPWLVMGNHGGSAGPLRQGKNTTFEGGVRVPAIARWPGRIPAGHASAEPMGLIDVLPTVAALAGLPVPDGMISGSGSSGAKISSTGSADSIDVSTNGARIIDGRNVWPILTGVPGASTPHEALYFYRGGELRSLRSGPWKLHLPHQSEIVLTPGVDGTFGMLSQESVGLELYDLRVDQGETNNVVADHPEVVGTLMDLVESARADLGDTLTGRVGEGVREAGTP